MLDLVTSSREGSSISYLVRRLQRQNTGDAQAIHSYRRIVQAVVWVIGGTIAPHTLGIVLTHILTAGGLFAVALAFAMKDLAENLVSGLLLAPHVQGRR